ncbi:hypothetical protein [Rhodococcus opacus]|uniref:hypothetical protein n=1 Tax=Rhodococcus opacus TaxID=37919 RepID=UPI0002F322F3|nr:hypothetical protein [Rhodococcus opacus]
MSAKPSADPDTNTEPRHLLTTAYTAAVTAVASDDADVSSPLSFGLASDGFPDPATHQFRPGPGWVSAADAGWSAARHAAHSPVEVTEIGLPQRIPGDRVVPGGLGDAGTARRRDPEALRDNLNRHLSGVRDGRATSRPNP